MSFRVVFHGKGKILFSESYEAVGYLVLLSLDLGRDRHGIAGLGELYSLERYNVLGIAESIAGLGLVELAHRADIAAGNALDLDILLAHHVVDMAHLLAAAGAAVG